MRHGQAGEGEELGQEITDIRLCLSPTDTPCDKCVALGQACSWRSAFRRKGNGPRHGKGTCKVVQTNMKWEVVGVHALLQCY